MKSITPVSIWQNGEVVSADKLVCSISYDDLSTFATFDYNLLRENVTDLGPINVAVVKGNVTISGQDYIDWDDSNEQVYIYVAEKLNLSIAAQ